MEQINVIIAVTNFVALIPMIKSILMGDYILGVLIFSMMMASFISHLAESRHGLPGYWLVEYFAILNWIDIILAIILIGYNYNRINMIYFKLSEFPNNTITLGLTAIVFWFIAQLSGNNTYRWSVFHSIWHVVAFLTLDSMLY
jgi:hypothetical protein